MRPHQPACSYYQPPGAAPRLATQDRCVYPGLQFEISDVPASYEFLDGKPGVERVDGIGEKALWNEQSKQLAVVKDSKDIAIRAADREAALTAARAITARCCP